METIFDREEDYSEHTADSCRNNYRIQCCQSDYSDTEYESEYHIPIGCTSCRGDYPICKTNCPMFHE